MTTLSESPTSKLGIDLLAFRTDRPDEWRMDEFTKQAEAMALQIKELEAALKECSGVIGRPEYFDDSKLSDLFEVVSEVLKEINHE